MQNLRILTDWIVIAQKLFNGNLAKKKIFLKIILIKSKIYLLHKLFFKTRKFPFPFLKNNFNLLTITHI